MPNLFNNTNIYCDPGPCDAPSLILNAILITLGSLSIYFVIFYVLFIISSWKIFTKAGEKGWKSLIPFYNMYILFKIVNMKGWFWFMIGLSIVVSLITSINGLVGYTISDFDFNNFDFQTHLPTFITLVVFFFINLYVLGVYCWRTSKVFGHGKGWAIGLFLIPNLFWLMLGFGKSTYSKKVLRQFARKKK